MLHFLGVYEESEKIKDVLIKKNLLKQYLSAKKIVLLGGKSKGIDLKIRQPKHKGIYSFRINKQFRAFGREKDGYLIIFEISNHSKF